MDNDKFLVLAITVIVLSIVGLIVYAIYANSFYKSLKNYRERKMILKVIDVLYWSVFVFGLVSLITNSSTLEPALEMIFTKVGMDTILVYIPNLIKDKRKGNKRTGIMKVLDSVFFIIVILVSVMGLVMWNTAKAESSTN